MAGILPYERYNSDSIKKDWREKMKNKKMMSVAFVFLLSTMAPTYLVWANDDEDENEYENEEHGQEDDEYEYEYQYEEDVDKKEYGDEDDSQYSDKVDEQKNEEKNNFPTSQVGNERKYEKKNGFSNREATDEKKDDSTYWKQASEQRAVNGDNQNVQAALVDTAPAVTWDVWSRSVATNIGKLPFAISKLVTIENQGGQQLNSYVIPSKGEMMIATVTIAQLIGADVTYYPTNNIAEMKLDGKELIVKSGSNAVYENGVKTPMPVEAMMYQDELYIPFSVLTNGLGLTVSWDKAKQTFLIQQ